MFLHVLGLGPGTSPDTPLPGTGVRNVSPRRPLRQCRTPVVQGALLLTPALRSSHDFKLGQVSLQRHPSVELLWSRPLGGHRGGSHWLGGSSRREGGRGRASFPLVRRGGSLEWVGCEQGERRAGRGDSLRGVFRLVALRLLIGLTPPAGL
ncbi:hypothetical protein E2C01_062741 [Portunus trituberculatus]|uniref:Uncharacterized protein n=1 Tax=Portunus trituberculatus TaxID=210409 RepID=A0A5B7HFI8_PORTR|nr:hypothetical protein [Portunus trituberculatus]